MLLLFSIPCSFWCTGKRDYSQEAFRNVVVSLVAQSIKNLPAMQGMQGTQVQSLCWGDPLEEEMATHSSTLAGKIPWSEEPRRGTVHGVAKSWTQLSYWSDDDDEMRIENEGHFLLVNHCSLPDIISFKLFQIAVYHLLELSAPYLFPKLWGTRW